MKVVTAVSSLAAIVVLFDGRPWLAFGIAFALLVVGTASGTDMIARIPWTVSARIVWIGILGIAASLVMGFSSKAKDNETSPHPSMSAPKLTVNKRPLDDDFQKAMEKASSRR
jgi:hypothetical protein